MEPGVLVEGARLVHIGFRKCGSTALQGALARARLPLASLGVVYPGGNGNHTPAALAVTGRTHGWTSLGARPQPMERWDALVAEVAAVPVGQRVVVSSEFFDVADAATIRTVVAGLGGERVHVVVTARPLARILPSAWQQQVQVGMRSRYGTWLRDVLDHEQSRTYQTFWERHDQAAVLSRWAGVVGPDRVTLMVLDEHDRALPYRGFETMLGVPAGTLVERAGDANRSLTGPEAELIRRINVEVFQRDITWDEYSQWIRRGAARRMVKQRTPGPDEPRTHTPQWAVERATEISAGFLRRIETLGVEVVGDLNSLAAAPPARTGPDDTDTDLELVPIDAAVQAVLGSSFSTRTQRPAKPTPKPTPPAATTRATRPASELPARDLAAALTRRIRDRVRRSWRRTRRGRLNAE